MIRPEAATSFLVMLLPKVSATGLDNERHGLPDNQTILGISLPVASKPWRIVWWFRPTGREGATGTPGDPRAYHRH